MSQSNEANFDNNGSYTDPVNRLTPVGTFSASPGPYGTYDMGGDINEWNERILGDGYRGAWGGGWGDPSNNLDSSANGYINPTGVSINVGFRVASVPEPTSIALLLAGGFGLLAFAWRRKRMA